MPRRGVSTALKDAGACTLLTARCAAPHEDHTRVLCLVTGPTERRGMRACFHGHAASAPELSDTVIYV